MENYKFPQQQTQKRGLVSFTPSTFCQIKYSNFV